MATRLRISVAFWGGLELARDSLIAFDAVMEGSVALDLRSLGRCLDVVCEDESRRW